MRILVLNGGSSSFKCWFRNLPDGVLPPEAPQPEWSARADWSGRAGAAEISILREDGAKVERQIQAEAPAAVLEPVLESLWKGEAACIDGAADIDVVGHRIVHGGPKYRSSTPLTSRSARRDRPGSGVCAGPQSLRAGGGGDGGSRGWNGRAASGRVRYRVSRHVGAARVRICRAVRMAGTRRASIWIPRHQPSIRVAARGRSAGPRCAVSEDRSLPSRQWRVAGRGARRKERGHHHGIHAAGRAHDGDALRVHRSGHPDLPCSGIAATRPNSWIES